VWALTAEVVKPAPVFRIVPATPHDVPAILAMMPDWQMVRLTGPALAGLATAAPEGGEPGG
jgi:hypothetical protein